MCSRERAFTVLIVEDQSLITLNIEDPSGLAAVSSAAPLKCPTH
jgi:hypothetical protein